MATIIDSLFLELGFDTTKIVKGQKEASVAVKKTSEEFEKHGKVIEKQAANFGEAVGNSTVKLLGLFAVMLMGGKSAREFTQYITDADTALGKSSRNIGISADALAEWQSVVKESGGKAEDATSSIQALSANIAQLRLGHVPEQFMEGWTRIVAFGGKTMDPFKGVEKNLIPLSENLKRIADTQGPAVALQLARMIGINEDYFNVLVRGSEVNKKLLEQAKQRGIANKESIEQATALTKAWADTKQSGESLGRTIFNLYNSDLIGFNENVAKAAEKTKEWFDQIKKIDDAGSDETFNKNIENFGKRWREMLDQMWHLFGEFGNKIGESGSFMLSMFQQAFSGVFLWLKKSFNEIWEAVFGHPKFGDAGTTGSAIMEGLGYGATPRSTGGGESHGSRSNRMSGSGSSRGGGSPGSPGWWTPERQQHAYEKLKAAGLSDMGAKGLVSRWAFVESSGGPTSVNRTSGAFGIGQWLGSRKPGIAGNTDFDAQLDYVVKELNSSESRAANLLRNARTPEEAARAATAYERAEGWNAATNTDRFTGTTQSGIGRIHTGGGATSGSGQTDPHKPGFDPNAVKFHDYFPKSGASPSSSNATTNNTSHQAHITINSSAGNPHEIAKAVKDAIDRTSYAMHGNYSLA